MRRAEQFSEMNELTLCCKTIQTVQVRMCMSVYVGESGRKVTGVDSECKYHVVTEVTGTCHPHPPSHLTHSHTHTHPQASK